jgi:hypothetical protein
MEFTVCLDVVEVTVPVPMKRASPSWIVPPLKDEQVTLVVPQVDPEFTH